MLLVDTADKALILEALQSPAVRGFTTNPNLIAQAVSGDALTIAEYVEYATALCDLASGAAADLVHHMIIQGVGAGSEILKQAMVYKEKLKRAANTELWIKLLPTNEGIACCEPLKHIGCKILITGTFSPAQAFVAAEAGADGVAVYVGRLMRAEKEWQKQLERIALVLRKTDRLMLMASFPDVATVEAALEYSQDLTIPPLVLNQLLANEHSEQAISVFNSKVVFP